MTVISKFADRQNAYNAQIEKALAGLTGDIEAFKDLVDTIQNSPGSVSVEDQRTLDDLESRSNQLADKLRDLDALTPPVVK